MKINLQTLVILLGTATALNASQTNFRPADFSRPTKGAESAALENYMKVHGISKALATEHLKLLESHGRTLQAISADPVDAGWKVEEILNSPLTHRSVVERINGLKNVASLPPVANQPVSEVPKVRVIAKYMVDNRLVDHDLASAQVNDLESKGMLLKTIYDNPIAAKQKLEEILHGASNQPSAINTTATETAATVAKIMGNNRRSTGNSSVPRARESKATLHEAAVAIARERGLDVHDMSLVQPCYDLVRMLVKNNDVNYDDIVAAPGTANSEIRIIIDRAKRQQAIRPPVQPTPTATPATQAPANPAPQNPNRTLSALFRWRPSLFATRRSTITTVAITCAAALGIAGLYKIAQNRKQEKLSLAKA